MAYKNRSGKKLSSKKSNRSKILNFFNPKTFKGGLALFVIVFVLVGGGYFAYKSYALGTAAIKVNVSLKSNQHWYSKRYSTSKGAVLVMTNFNTPWPSLLTCSYFVSQQQLQWDKWVTVTSEQTKSANGNMDTFWFDHGIGKGGVYRTKIRGCNWDIGGTVWIVSVYDPDGNGQ